LATSEVNGDAEDYNGGDGLNGEWLGMDWLFGKQVVKMGLNGVVGVRSIIRRPTWKMRTIELTICIVYGCEWVVQWKLN
jgi:hypothetical protein